MDSFKLTLGFMAEIMYIKGIICHEELEAILDVHSHKELGAIVENMLQDKYNPYKRGEVYVGFGK